MSSTTGVMSSTTRKRVAELLGREPEGAFEVVVTDESGDPLVIRNDPFLADGRPMPTRYWLVGENARRAVSRLESLGGVRLAESEVDRSELANAHARYAAERDAAIDESHQGPRPSGGVGGTRIGVKCLHAHFAWYLAGGDDPVGRWVAEKLTVFDQRAVADELAVVDELASDGVTGSGAASSGSGSSRSEMS